MDSASPCRSYFVHLVKPELGDTDGRFLCASCNQPREVARQVALLKQEIEYLKLLIQNQKRDFEQSIKCCVVQHKFKLETTQIYKCTECGIKATL